MRQQPSTSTPFLSLLVLPKPPPSHPCLCIFLQLDQHLVQSLGPITTPAKGHHADALGCNNTHSPATSCNWVANSSNNSQLPSRHSYQRHKSAVGLPQQPDRQPNYTDPMSKSFCQQASSHTPQSPNMIDTPTFHKPAFQSKPVPKAGCHYLGLSSANQSTCPSLHTATQTINKIKS